MHTFSGKLGSATWNEKMEFKSNSYISFNVHSNKDLKLNNSFYLKFSVTAYGFEELRDNKIQIKDLCDSITCIFGNHLSRCYMQRLYQSAYISYKADQSLNTKHADHIQCSSSPKMENENSEYIASSLSSSSVMHIDAKTNPFFAYQQPSVLASHVSSSSSSSNTKQKIFNNYNSEFYRILLRGGHESSNELTTEANEDNGDALLSEFLINDLNNIFRKNDFTEKAKDDLKVFSFLKFYDKNFETYDSALAYARTKMGGLNLSELVLKIFSCLVWHTPSIKNKDVLVKNELIAQAFKAAESTRLFIIEQQQQLKANQKEPANNDNSFTKVINEKLDYLLQLDRVPEQLLNYELIKSNYATNLDSFESYNICDLTDHYTNSQCKLNKRSNKMNVTHSSKLKAKHKAASSSSISVLLNRLPKFDSLPTLNLIYEFIFDQQINNLESIQQILQLKRKNSILIAQNFELATQYLQNLLSLENENKNVYILEYLLTFMSTFFGKTSPQRQHQTGTKLGKFPPNLQCYSSHFLQNLYGCGLKQEEKVRKSYFKFLNLILSFEQMQPISTIQSDSLIERLKLRLKCFTVSWLNIDWDLYDLKFFDELNIVGYLLRSSFSSMPIRYYKCEKNQTNSQVLEEIFKLSRENFNLNNNSATALKSEIIRINRSDAATMPSKAEILETEETEERSSTNKTENLDEDDENSFDMKIYPKLYQSLFQTNSSSSTSASSTAKPFDTDVLMKCLSVEIKTYEHYEKFIVARYMFWKYFAKLRANFYCDECEVMLTENRYVCLECREHCLCFNCFAKSCLDTSSDQSDCCSSSGTASSKWNTKKSANNFYCTQHRASHRMLLLDHLCDRCGSLIIGKRIHCEECDDFDLCLMCYKQFEQVKLNGADGEQQLPTHKNNHTKEHNITIIQPVIIVAKPDYVLDIQVYLYLNTQMLFSIFTIKLSTLMANIDMFSKDQMVINSPFIQRSIIAPFS